MRTRNNYHLQIISTQFSFCNLMDHVTRVTLKNQDLLFFSLPFSISFLNLVYSPPFFLSSPFLIFALFSSFKCFVLVHLDNFLSHWAIHSLLFIMNGDFQGIFYFSMLSFYIKYSDARQAAFINVEVIVESSISFKKLPRRSLCLLEFYLLSGTFFDKGL